MKTILVLVLLVSLTTVSYAQDTHFGLKAGVNISSLDVKRGVDGDAKAGVHFGGLAHVHLASHLAVQPEIVFSQQGAKFDGDKWKINYLNIPVLLQFMTGSGFRIQTGPQLGFAISSKVKSGNVEVDNKDDVNTVDFAWSFGASYLFPEGIGIDARYNHSITNLYEPEVPEIRNRVFQVGLFYQFMSAGARQKRK